jgi:hypothetical protein
MDMICRARQHFGNRATLMRTNFGTGIVLFHATLVRAPAFHQGFGLWKPPQGRQFFSPLARHEIEAEHVGMRRRELRW